MSMGRCRWNDATAAGRTSVSLSASCFLSAGALSARTGRTVHCRHGEAYCTTRANGRLGTLQVLRAVQVATCI
eukprot:5654532-Amphidinium_carterae.1